MATMWKDDLCPSCKTYICFTDGYAVCKTCKLSVDNTHEEQLELPLDFEEDNNDR